MIPWLRFGRTRRKVPSEVTAAALHRWLHGSHDAAWSAGKPLGTSKDPAVLAGLLQALQDPSYRCVCAALALGRIGNPRAVAPLVGVLNDRDRFWVPRGAAAVGLGFMGPAAAEALPALEAALAFPTRTADETWDPRACEAVEDAILHITLPGAPCLLKRRGYRFEMWGIY